MAAVRTGDSFATQAIGRPAATGTIGMMTETAMYQPRIFRLLHLSAMNRLGRYR